MDTKHRERRKTLSCGGLPWKVIDGKVAVLLIKQFSHSDSWGIPKGHIKAGETPEQCALREIKEETGIEVVLGARLPDIGSLFRDEDKTVASWLCTPVGDDKPRLDDPDSEVADARWFNAESLPTIHRYQQPLIVTAIDLIDNVLGPTKAPKPA